MAKNKPIPHSKPAIDNSKIELHFVFSPHMTYEHGADLAAVAAEVKPHVICVENAAGDQKAAANISRHFRELANDGYMQRVAHIAQEHKAQVFALERFNPQAAQGINRRHASAAVDCENALLKFEEGNATQALKLYRQAIEKTILDTQAREEEVARNLKQLQALLHQHFPLLKKEPVIRVVVPYGAAHSSLFEAAKSMQFRRLTKRITAPMHLPLLDALTRRVIYKKTSRISDEEVAQALISHLVTAQVNEVTDSKHKAIAVGAIEGKRITLDKFHEIAKTATELKNTHLACAQHDVFTPTSTREVDTYLKRKLGSKMPK